MSPLRLLLFPAGLAVALFCAGCATHAKVLPSPPAPLPKPIAGQPRFSWNDDGSQGTPSIAISLSQQRAYFFRGEKLIGDTVISSGKARFETASGHFKVIQKDKDHVSNLYGIYVDEAEVVVKKNADVSKDPLPEGATFQGAKMPFFLRFNGGTGLHAGHVPNYRASHGCIRLPRTMAQHFFENAELGTPVTVED